LAWYCLSVLAYVNCFLMAFSRQRYFFGPARHWGFACGMFYLFPCIFSVKNIGFSSLSAKEFNDVLLDFYTRRWASFLVNFLYQTLLFRFLGFRLRYLSYICTSTKRSSLNTSASWTTVVKRSPFRNGQPWRRTALAG